MDAFRETFFNMVRRGIDQRTIAVADIHDPKAEDLHPRWMEIGAFLERNGITDDDVEKLAQSLRRTRTDNDMVDGTPRFKNPILEEAWRLFSDEDVENSAYWALDKIVGDDHWVEEALQEYDAAQIMADLWDMAAQMYIDSIPVARDKRRQRTIERRRRLIK